jgi:hypothetical protein
MAKVIEFCVSDSLPRKSNYIARKESRKLVEFRVPKRNQANSNSAQWPGMCMAYICTIRGKLCERSNRRHHVSTAGENGAIPMRNFGDLARLIRPAGTHL